MEIEYRPRENLILDQESHCGARLLVIRHFERCQERAEEAQSMQLAAS